jgi:hypothetical protein
MMYQAAARDVQIRRETLVVAEGCTCASGPDSSQHKRVRRGYPTSQRSGWLIAGPISEYVLAGERGSNAASLCRQKSLP